MPESSFIAPSFTDHRGYIANVLSLPDDVAPIRHVALIVSGKNAIRGNHVHAQDSHYSYILSGACRYIVQNWDGENEVVELGAGDLVFTPEGEPHAFEFLEDSVMFAFTTRQRTDEKTGDAARYKEDTKPCVIWGLE